MRSRYLILVLIASGLFAACSTTPPTSSLAASIDPTPTTPPFRVVSDIVYASLLQEDGDSWMLDIYAPNDAGNWLEAV